MPQIAAFAFNLSALSRLGNLSGELDRFTQGFSQAKFTQNSPSITPNRSRVEKFQLGTEMAAACQQPRKNQGGYAEDHKCSDILPFSIFTSDMRVPFLDLKAHHDPMRKEITEAVSEVIDASAFAGGPFVERFEKSLANFCQVDHAIGVGSGTESLWLALLANGIGRGDEVITVPSTFIATAEAISHVGAKPVFVDIMEESYNMDPSKLEAAINSKTKAIIPVHLFGQMADMDPIMLIAKKHGLFVVEDAAQAIGAEYKGRRAGAVGHCASFSFYPGKNLGALGEAGAITTNDSDLAKRIRILRDHGQTEKYCHSEIGWNGRMDGIQAAVLDIKLKRLDDSTRRRRENAALYHDQLDDFDGVILPAEVAEYKHVYHVFSIRVKRRDKIMDDMAKEGIGCAIHYPVPIHLQAAYQDLEYESGSFPVAEQCASEFLSLPMFPELTSLQISRIVEALKKAVRSI